VVETNGYYHDHLDRLDEGPSPLPNKTEAEMLVFLVITIQMGQTDRLLVNHHQFHTHFYSSAMEQDRYLHLLHSLHFTNKFESDMTDENSDRLRKIRNLFKIMTFSKFYSPSEHLIIDEVIVLYKERVIFQQYIPKKHKRFGIKIYKLRDKTG